MKTYPTEDQKSTMWRFSVIYTLEEFGFARCLQNSFNIQNSLIFSIGPGGITVIL